MPVTYPGPNTYYPPPLTCHSDGEPSPGNSDSSSYSECEPVHPECPCSFRGPDKQQRRKKRARGRSQSNSNSNSKVSDSKGTVMKPAARAVAGAHAVANPDAKPVDSVLSGTHPRGALPPPPAQEYPSSRRVPEEDCCRASASNNRRSLARSAWRRIKRACRKGKDLLNGSRRPEAPHCPPTHTPHWPAPLAHPESGCPIPAPSTSTGWTGYPDQVTKVTISPSGVLEYKVETTFGVLEYY